MADMESRVELNYLLDFYGPLLTAHRQEVMRLYCEEDLSQQEIAEQLGCTRQSVHELITRSGEKLRSYENAIGAAERMRQVVERLENAAALLRSLTGRTLPPEAQREAEDVLRLIEQTIEQEENDHGI